MAALWIVRQFSKQIRRDLHRFHHGCKLADWWRGTRGPSGDLVLSSSELLNYLEYMDEGGAFKTDAQRGGAWPGWKQMLAENTNEAYRFRSSYHLVSSRGESTFETEGLEFIDPVIREQRERNAAADAEAARDSQDRFEAQIGWS